MSSFQTRIEDLIGSVGDTTLITNSIQEVGAEIISALPDHKLMQSSKTTAVSSSGLDISGMRVLSVDKDGFTAREIPASEKTRYNDPDSIYAGSDTDPLYYFKDYKIYIQGDADGGLESGTLHHVPKIPTHDGTTSITYSSTTTVNFPIEARNLIVIGGAVKCLQKMLSDKTAFLPSDITSPSLLLAPIPPTLSSNSVSFSETAPVYNMPILSLGSAPTISNLTISTSIPTAPTLTGSTVFFSQTAPVYTAPSLDASSDQITEMESGTLGSGHLDTETWFDIAGQYIEDLEDVELATAQLQKINSYLQAYQSAVQNQLNKFNDANVEYQAELQKAIKNADLSVSDDVQAIQKYSSQIQSYQAEVAKQVQVYQQNLEGDLRVWQAERQTDLQKYNSDIQNALNAFNDANTEYQASLQVALQNAQLSSQDDAQLLQKYSGEVQSYQSDTGSVIQKFNSDLQNYTVKIQKHTTDYQWKQGQYQMLKSEYNQGLQLLIGSGIPQRQGA